MTVAEKRWVGTPMKRREDPKFISGKGKYLDDLKFGLALHTALLRSPHGHARIVSLDASRARAFPGVSAVITGDEVAAMTKPGRSIVPLPVELPTYCLAYRKVRYAGEPVAAVAAVDRATAEDAVDLIEVEYEPLPAVTDVEASAKPGAPLLFEELGTNVMWHASLPFGEVDQAFEAADLVVRERITIHRYASTPLETYGCAASYDEGSGNLTVWGHAHVIGMSIAGLASSLGMPVSKIRLVQPDVGGAFGNKERVAYLLLVAILAKATGRTVKYVEDRRESLMGLSQACDGVTYCEAAVKRDGTILAMRFRNLENEGSNPQLATIHSMLMLTNVVNCYKMRAVSFESSAVLSNKCPSGANRGVGKPFMNFAMERTVDRIAQELGMDPAEVRFKNFIPADQFPYETPSGDLYDSADYAETLWRALSMVDYEGQRREQAEARKQGRYLGIGISNGVEPGMSNFSYGLIVSDKQLITGVGEAARVKIEFDGTVTVSTGAVSEGQGHDTAISQVVADELGIHPDRVNVLPFDSATSPWLPTSGNYSNKFSGNDTAAILGALGKVKEKLFSLAAQQLEVAPEDLEMRDGRISARGVPDKSKAIAEVAAPAYFRLGNRGPDFEPGVEAVHYYSNPHSNLPDEQKRVRTQMNFSNAAHVAVVEVDPETFEVKVLRYVVVHDCGVEINPLIVEGQVHGATVHGIAAALLEEFVYTEDGQLLTTSFMDYLKPTAADAPMIETGRLETPSPFTPLGTKGAGEGGAIPSPAAIANAVEDALAPLAIKITGLPITASKLRDMVAAARG